MAWKKRFEGRHFHLSASVSHCFEISASVGGPSYSCPCGLSLAPLADELLPLTQQQNPSSVAVPGLCAEVEDVYRTQSLASRNSWSNRGDTGGLDNDMQIACRSWLLETVLQWTAGTCVFLDDGVLRVHAQWWDFWVTRFLKEPSYYSR